MDKEIFDSENWLQELFFGILIEKIKKDSGGRLFLEKKVSANARVKTLFPSIVRVDFWENFIAPIFMKI